MDAPINEGVAFVGPSITDKGTLVKYELNLGQAESLARLAEDYSFFSPALLYLYGHFYDGLLLDYMYEQRENVKIFTKLFRRPIFDGLAVGADGSWNHALFAVRRDQWGSLCDCILMVTLAFSAQKTLIRYGEQKLQIVDPIAADKVSTDNTPPMVEITAFGVLSGQHQILFQSAPEGMLPRPVAIAPLPEIALEAAAYFAGKNPVNARTNYRNQKGGQRHAYDQRE